MLRKFILSSLILMIFSCSLPQIGFFPLGDILPDAKVGVPYNQKIIIGTNLEDNPEFLTAENTQLDIYLADIGLQVFSDKKEGMDYLYIIIFPFQVCRQNQDS
ncbi:hypothetical protein ACI00O_001422 [Cronobacter sakazakii]|nr:hypothetical protein [Cronobacter sakazakii]